MTVSFNCAAFSSVGRSCVTDIAIPNTAETNASRPNPTRVRNRRSLRSRGLRGRSPRPLRRGGHRWLGSSRIGAGASSAWISVWSSTLMKSEQWPAALWGWAGGSAVVELTGAQRLSRAGPAEAKSLALRLWGHVAGQRRQAAVRQAAAREGAHVGMGPAEAAAWLSRNTVDSLPDGGLQAKLSIGRPLRVKLGIDPTAPDIHLGFTVVLQKLREFQDLGHIVVLILGDYTARVGDPSGRSATRPVLSGAQIDANARTFQEQALKVLDPGRLEVVYNSAWLYMKLTAVPVTRNASPSHRCSSETISPSASRREPRSRCSSCCIRCCRVTTRSRFVPTSSSVAPIRSSTY